MDDLAIRIVKGIPADSGLTAEQLWQARHLVDACRRVATRSVTPSQLGSDITGLRAGFGPWLNSVRSAIERAEMPALERASLLGAFEMATVILFDAAERRYLRDRKG